MGTRLRSIAPLGAEKSTIPLRRRRKRLHMTSVIGADSGMADASRVTVPRIRRIVVVLAALALVSLQLVHADHIHPAGVEGRTQSLVHSHPLAFAVTGGARAFAAHGDHRLAIFLAPVYESANRLLLDHPLHVLIVLGAADQHQPRFHAVGRVRQFEDRHPPGIIDSASPERAPPIS